VSVTEYDIPTLYPGDHLEVCMDLHVLRRQVPSLVELINNRQMGVKIRIMDETGKTVLTLRLPTVAG
jgi:hypothetical protein